MFDTTILGYELVQTCGACPEQYDVYRDGQEVGYFRLRHGYFAAYANGPSGQLVYDAQPKGDGIFDPDEREHFLTVAILSLDAHLKANP
jgi:hypothetical protein